MVDLLNLSLFLIFLISFFLFAWKEFIVSFFVIKFLFFSITFPFCCHIFNLFLYFQVFSVLFFFMLFVLGIGSNIAMCSCIITAIHDQFPKWKPSLVCIGVAIAGFSIGLFYVTPVSKWLYIDFTLSMDRFCWRFMQRKRKSNADFFFRSPFVNVLYFDSLIFLLFSCNPLTRSPLSMYFMAF